MKERCKDLLGVTVRLLEPLQNAGGERFPKGSLMRVATTHRGLFTLESPMRDGGGHWRGVSFIARRKFSLVNFQPKLTDREFAVLGELAEPNDNADGSWLLPRRWVRRAKELVRLGLALELDGEFRVYTLTPAGRALWKNRSGLAE